MTNTGKPKPVEKQSYLVLQTTWIGTHLKAVDDTVQMTANEAKYYVPHILKLKEEAKAENPEPIPPTKKPTTKPKG